MEKELQEVIKKYVTEIQAKKQKKYKRDVLDYQNMKVYKWQTTIADIGDVLEDDLLDVSPDTFIDLEQEALITNTHQQIRTNMEHPYRQQGTPYRHQGGTNTRRVNYQEQVTSRTPQTPRYNVTTRNRFSPLRENRHAQYGRAYEDLRDLQQYRNPRHPRDFPRLGPQDRPPGRWRAQAYYRNPGWREIRTEEDLKEDHTE